MILISYPHYTCGGLLCNIINNEYHGFANNGGMDNIAHSLAKLGDTDSIQDKVDIDELHRRFEWRKERNLPIPHAVGTHCTLVNYPTEYFEKVINVTTETSRSKIYRWIRAYELMYKHEPEWQNLSEQMFIDKARETAKNYVIPYPSLTKDNIINIEFADIVEMSPYATQLLNDYDYSFLIDTWQEKNKFLYSSTLWNHEAVIRYHEAELESMHGARYVYG